MLKHVNFGKSCVQLFSLPVKLFKLCVKDEITHVNLEILSH